MPSSAKAQREWRKKRTDRSAASRRSWRARNKFKTNAHAKVQTELEAGRLLRLPCEKCGNPISQAHHEYYEKPMEITWLCALHHKQRHKELKADCSSLALASAGAS